MACGGCLRREKGVSKTLRAVLEAGVAKEAAGSEGHEHGKGPLHDMVNRVRAFLAFYLTHAVRWTYARNILDLA